MNRAFLVAVLAALVVISAWWQLAEMRARDEHARAQALRARIQQLLEHPAAADSAQQRREHVVLEDLAHHPELIPLKAVSGGTMRFVPAECRVLEPSWVYGYYEDGHIAGVGLFEFHRQPGGGFTWTRIAAAEL
ncbi:MAG TPA: hypothetical protein VFK69_03600 [Candidatus Eisenbacteria bacterium]|nr:hypothetical protein [Candidatus Eisenbacteria bacterium]